MGAALAVGCVAPNMAALAQDWHYSSRGERLARLAYELDFQGLRLDFISTIREEIRDQVSFILSGLDNLMVVATLMMSIGFGFVVEGTFPPSSAEELSDWCIPGMKKGVDPLVIYSILCALSLIMPFWCLIFTIRLRYEVDYIVRGHMTDLRKQLINVLKYNKIRENDPDDADNPQGGEADLEEPGVSGSLSAEPKARKRERRQAFCPKRLRRSVLVCPARAQWPAKAEDIADDLFKHVGPFSLTQEPVIEREQILRWAEQDLQGRMVHYMWYLKGAHIFLWLGMMAAIFTCAILLGMYMMENFPHTPAMWQAYSAPVCLSGILAIVYAAWMWLSGPKPAMVTTHKAWASSRQFDDFQSGIWSMRSLGQPLLMRKTSSDASRRPSTMSRSWSGAWNSSDRSASRQSSGVADADTRGSLPVFELRVRLAAGTLQGYQRVAFDGFHSRQVPPVERIKARILAKIQAHERENEFQRQGSPSSVHSERPQGLISLKRVRDELELVDDEDCAVLASGDKLEAVLELPVFNE